MGKVYYVGSIYKEVYFNTAKDCRRCKPGGEEPESVEVLDAAEECNRLMQDVRDAERTITSLRMLLEELRDVCSMDLLEGIFAGRRVCKFIADNPLPPADSADRDGGRSYGGG